MHTPTNNAERTHGGELVDPRDACELREHVRAEDHVQDGAGERAEPFERCSGERRGICESAETALEVGDEEQEDRKGETVLFYAVSRDARGMQTVERTV